MFEFFDQIVGFIETIWTVVINLINSLITAFSTLLVVISFPVTVMPFLPAILFTSLSVCIGIGVLKFVLGR